MQVSGGDVWSLFLWQEWIGDGQVITCPGVAKYGLLVVISCFLCGSGDGDGGDRLANGVSAVGHWFAL